jgi:hypothetical protein
MIPLLNGELTFHPSEDDQEIPVAGATRAIWEGAGQIFGTLRGDPVSGTARLELNGYGYLFHLSDVLDSFFHTVSLIIFRIYFPNFPTKNISKKCTGLLPEKGNVEAVREILMKPMWDLLNRGSKYWRPMFGILMTEVLDLDSRNTKTFFPSRRS